MSDKDNKEVYYVNIRNSHDLRRGILETSKQVIEGLHQFEKFKKLRAERIKAMEELILTFKDINDLSAQIKIDMPKIKLPPQKKPEKEPIIPSVKKPNKHESPEELKKLEEAIAQIEDRLNQIQ